MLLPCCFVQGVDCWRTCWLYLLQLMLMTLHCNLNHLILYQYLYLYSVAFSSQQLESSLIP